MVCPNGRSTAILWQERLSLAHGLHQLEWSSGQFSGRRLREKTRGLESE